MCVFLPKSTKSVHGDGTRSQHPQVGPALKVWPSCAPRLLFGTEMRSSEAVSGLWVPTGVWLWLSCGYHASLHLPRPYMNMNLIHATEIHFVFSWENCQLWNHDWYDSESNPKWVKNTLVSIDHSMTLGISEDSTVIYQSFRSRVCNLSVCLIYKSILSQFLFFSIYFPSMF